MTVLALAHTVYGGAHLFKHDTPQKLGGIALRVFHKYLSNDEEMDTVFGPGAHTWRADLKQRLSERPVDDYRIDFEDGFGLRSEQDEHDAARASGTELAQCLSMRQSLSLRRVGLRTRGWSHPERLAQTLQTFTEALGTADFGNVDFVVTLPKVSSTAQVARFADLLTEREYALGWPEGHIGIELLVEHPQALKSDELSTWVHTAGTRLRGLHLGAYDLLAELGVPHTAATLAHPYCNAARTAMRVACVGTSVDTVDGVTLMVPVEPHRSEALSNEEKSANQRAMHDSWSQHARDITRGISLGFYQGWDVHPAQLVSRHGANLNYFGQAAPEAQKRVDAFQQQARRARASGQWFDDEASMRSVELFLSRAANMKAKA